MGSADKQSGLQQFMFENVHGIRVIDRDGELWFVAADVCKALDILNARTAMARLADDEKDVHIMDTLGGPQQVTIINEPGLYALVWTSRKPEADKFKRWINHEVIPSIRKTGQYALSKMTPAELGLYHAQQIVDHERKILALQDGYEDHDHRITILETVTKTGEEFFTVKGYCKLKGLKSPTASVARSYGLQASKLSKKRGIRVDQVPDRQYGMVNSYHISVLDDVIPH